jgi:hypothetical protein
MSVPSPDMTFPDPDGSGPDGAPSGDVAPSAGIMPYEDLVWVCTNLSQLLEVENDALARHDAETVRQLGESKLALTRIYEQAMGPVVDNPALVEQLTEEQAEELRLLGAQLANLVLANVTMLKAEIECHERVMDVFVEAAKAQTSNTVNYGRGGTFDPFRPAGAQASLAFNKTL